jgi:hypothetical protein
MSAYPHCFVFLPETTAMSPDRSKYGREHRIRRKRVQMEIAAGRGVCELCGWPIGSADHWSLVQEVGAVHSRCGFERGLLGKSASRDW